MMASAPTNPPTAALDWRMGRSSVPRRLRAEDGAAVYKKVNALIFPRTAALRVSTRHSSAAEASSVGDATRASVDTHIEAASRPPSMTARCLVRVGSRTEYDARREVVHP